jgi:acid phosphatase
LPDSLVWFRTAVEHRGLATQAYRLASALLDRALAAPSWTAAIEQGQDFAGKPPAVILDIDETVLDNSEFEERVAGASAAQREERWGAWCRERKATPIPGALEFTRTAQAKGVTVFYVSNRSASVEEVTRQNLAASGFPLDERRDTVLTRGERREWTAEKSTRRELVARDFRILLLVGDDFADFLPGARSTLAARRALSEKHDAMWGVKWIVLPNPIYGSWKRAAGQ